MLLRLLHRRILVWVDDSGGVLVSVDLSDQLIESIKGEVSPPGTDLFPDATDDEWLVQLENSFWEARLFGFFAGFTESDGLITPLSGSTDLDRANQQLIVLFAAGRIIRNELTGKNTLFRAKAGPVEFEVQNSAQMMVAILRDIRSKIDLALAALGEINSTTVAYIDSLVGREESIYYGDTFFWSSTGRGGSQGNGNWW